MKPEENNPTAEGEGMVLSMADSLASAEDSLTSAGLAAKDAGSDAVELDQLGASDPAATMARPDEPLIPAAPVPGSIGSVISGPALADLQAEFTEAIGEGPKAPESVTPATDAMIAEMDANVNPAVAAAPSAEPTDGMSFVAPEAAPVMETPVAESAMPMEVPMAEPVSMPAVEQPTDALAAQAVAEVPPAAPYNPFLAGVPSNATAGTVNPFANQTPAQPPAAPVQAPAQSSTAVPEALKPKTEKFSPKAPGSGKLLTIILAVVAVLSIVMSVVFAILWQSAKNEKKIVYVPTAPVEETVPEPVEDAVVDCTKTVGTEAGEGLANFVGANIAVQLKFANGELANMNTLTAYGFADATSAEAARAAFEGMVQATEVAMAGLGTAKPLMTASFSIAGTAVNYRMVTDIEQMKEMPEVLSGLDLPKDDDGSVLLDQDSVTTAFAAQGYTCVEE